MTFDASSVMIVTLEARSDDGSPAYYFSIGTNVTFDWRPQMIWTYS
jgi:hypothetical protein